MRTNMWFFITVCFVSLALGAAVTAGVSKAEKKDFPIDTEGTCISSSCHGELGTKKFIHEVAADGSECTECHEVKEKGLHSFKIAAEGGELCVMCHDPMGTKKSVHSPVAEGECTECHDPHQSDNPKQLVQPPTQKLCFECHEEDDFEGSVTHGPVREGKCLGCHSPHSSDNPKQLVKAVPDLCVTCHGIELLDRAGIAIAPEKSLFEAKEVNLHKPFKEGKCMSCHFPHRSDINALLRGKYPSLIYSKYSEESYGLCLSCHEDLVKVLENPRTLTDTKFRNGNLNLHNRHVNREKGRACKACHHHHGTKNPRLIRKTFYFGTMELAINYEKTETGGACAPSCHVPVKYDRYEPAEVMMKTSPRQGEDATPEELKKSRVQESAPGAGKSDRSR